MLHSEDYMKIFHEIKNNIAIINSYLQLVEKRHPEVKGFDYWADSMNEVSRLSSIVIELSKVRLGNGLNPQLVNICDSLKEIRDSLQGMKQEWPDMHFSLVCKTDPLPILIDPSQLRHAFMNLFKNSCEAMDYVGTVSVTVEELEGIAMISLADSGGGFSPKIEDHAFEPFVSTKENGTGLGLVIAREIIEAYRGRIEWESRPGDGCTFFIYFPRFDHPPSEKACPEVMKPATNRLSNTLLSYLGRVRSSVKNEDMV